MIIYEEIFKKYGLSPTQKEILKTVGKDKMVLEIGSSVGYMTKAFLDNGCSVDVVETNKEAVSKIPKKVRAIFNQSIEDTEIYKLLKPDYEYIIMADVLEHLVNPSAVLKKLLKVAHADTKLLISLPNIACWAMRKQLFFKGDFKYQDSGLLDRTHLHFYTVNTLPKLLSENGWKVKKVIGTIVRLPFEETINKIPILGMIFRQVIYKRSLKSELTNSLYKKLVEKYKNLSYYHFLTIAQK